MLEQINTENFHQMLSQFSTGELESMIEKFPYFQQAHLLLAKKYQQENSPKFDQQLQLAALYIQDRELLYNLFNDKNDPIPVIVDPVNILEPKQKEVAAEQITKIEVKQITEPVIVVEPEKKQIETETLPVAKQEYTTQVLNTADDIALALQEIKQSMGAIQQIAEAAKTDQPAETKQIADAEIKDKQKNSSVAETPQEEIPAIKQIEEINTVLATPDFEEVTDAVTDEISAKAEQQELQVFSRISPHTFDEWLKAFNNKTVSKSTEKEIARTSKHEDEELTQLYAANVTSDYLHTLVKEETTYAKGLERFIEEQIQKHKQPEKPKKEHQNTIDNELVTETMAKVYQIQKKYNLAIKAYEALTLKFPEKSSLFAAQINLLKNNL